MPNMFKCKKGLCQRNVLYIDGEYCRKHLGLQANSEGTPQPSPNHPPISKDRNKDGIYN